jgi:GNAT superfamily N-acetyltransferase
MANAAPPAPPWRIEPWAGEDTPALVLMWRQSFEHGVGIIDPNPIEGQRRFFEDTVVPQNAVCVVRHGSQWRAFMAHTPQTICQLYVRVSHLGQGLGSALIARAKATSSGRLWLYTFAQNHRARRFYEHHGFVETERESQNMYRLEAIRCEWQRAAEQLSG